MSKAERERGLRAERDIVARLNAARIPAVRVPLSGQTAHTKSDVEVRLPGRKIYLEVKASERFPAYLLKWIEEADAVVLRPMRREPLVFLTWPQFTALLQDVEGI